MNTASNIEGQSSNHLIHGSQRVLIGKPSAPAKMGGARGLQNPPGTAPPASGRRQYSPLYNRNQRTAESPGCQISTKIQTSEVSRFQFSTWRSREARGRRSSGWTRSEAGQPIRPWDGPTRDHSEVEQPMPAEGGRCRPTTPQWLPDFFKNFFVNGTKVIGKTPLRMSYATIW